jgi:polar amino acid transport system substrate-binding protein
MMFLCRFLALAFIAGSVQASADTVKLCFNNYPPYVMGDESAASAPKGIKVDIATEVFKQLGVPVTIVTLPFKRCLALVESGAFDGTLPLYKNDEREKYMEFSHPANSQTVVFVYKKSRFPNGLTWDSYDDIKTLSLTINLGSIVDAKMESAFTSIKPIYRSTNIETMIRLLDGGYFDLGATDATVARYVISKLGLNDKLALTEKAIHNNPVYFGISKKSHALKLLPRINMVLDRMNKDGTMSKIIAK